MTEQTMGLIRHILTFVGGWLVTLGYFDESTISGLVGALTTVVGTVWSWWSKQNAASLYDNNDLEGTP